MTKMANPKTVLYIIVLFRRSETHKVMAKDDGIPNSFVAVPVREEGVASQGRIQTGPNGRVNNLLSHQFIHIRITFSDILLKLLLGVKLSTPISRRG
jgi:hypothetical protein